VLPGGQRYPLRLAAGLPVLESGASACLAAGCYQVELNWLGPEKLRVPFDVSAAGGPVEVVVAAP